MRLPLYIMYVISPIPFETWIIRSTVNSLCWQWRCGPINNKKSRRYSSENVNLSVYFALWCVRIRIDLYQYWQYRDMKTQIRIETSLASHKHTHTHKGVVTISTHLPVPNGWNHSNQVTLQSSQHFWRRGRNCTEHILSLCWQERELESNKGEDRERETEKKDSPLIPV